MDWDLTGKFVKALYVGDFPVYGKVEESRVAYGGGVKHHLQLIEPVVVFSAVRNHVCVDADEIVSVL